MCPFDCIAVAKNRKAVPVIQVNHDSAPTGRPKSVRSSCVIEHLDGVFLCCYFAFFSFPLV